MSDLPTVRSDRRRPRASVAATVLTVLTLLLAAFPMPVLAASSVSIEARPLLGGRYEVGGWAAVAVSLVNEGEPTEGYLEADGEDSVVRRFVEMPAGARKEVTLYVAPEAFQRRITVRYEEPNGTVEATVEVRVFEQTGDQVAIVGDGAGTLRPQLPTATGPGSPEPISIGVADLPDRLEPLRGLSGIVWAGDSSALTEDQRRSLASWVAEGGQLVVVGGPDWQARTDAFADLLPLESLTAVDGVALASLADWAGGSEPPVATATVSSGTLRPDARQLVLDGQGNTLVSMRDVGAGRVILLGPDLASEPFRGWTDGPALWGRLIPSNALWEQYFGSGMPPREEMANSMSQALGNLPSLEVPPVELLLLVVVAYILLIGPVNYLVLRRLDRRELAWVTAPVLVVLFSATSYGIGSAMKGSSVIINQVAVIRASTAGTAANVETYAGVFSPDRATYDVRVDADALLGLLNTSNFQPTPQNRADVVVEQGDPARMRELAVGVFGFESVRADAVTEHAAALAIEWERDGEDLVGVVTNVGDEPLEDVAYISRSGGEMVGDLAPGEAGRFEVTGSNFNASSASDQVYGFGGFDPANPDQREIAARRSIIDALVGYGSFMPPGTDLPSTGRGPYVIGWSASPGPLPVTVEGVEAQQYAQSVEVITVRPTLGTGELTIGPGMMTVSLVETEGDASVPSPGSIMIGQGSAVFDVSLPLEASGMAVEQVEVIAAPDPGMMVQDGGGFGGFWPAGYTFEVLDPSTGTWTLLGNLDQQSRYTIDDPATVITDAGRIRLRITGTADQAFGQNSFFVSAEVSGVLDQ